MLLTGTFPRAVDEKQRIAIPKRIRDALNLTESSVLYITRGTDTSLAVYTEEGLERLAERLAAASPTQNDVRAFSRLFYAQAEPVEVDSQGRVRIPGGLAQVAELGGEVVLVGVQDHLELWNRQRWESYLADKASQYDELAERAFTPQHRSTP
ncbi:MAG TPA: division/cell wall cluster transcriptional repressor MraZ [Pirellulales bacterium]|jgi:MraZ protein|nr:division/cell wall cluster transcriptional repressor MraZ [Pirellulales bacterium]